MKWNTSPGLPVLSGSRSGIPCLIPFKSPPPLSPRSHTFLCSTLEPGSFHLDPAKKTFAEEKEKEQGTETTRRERGEKSGGAFMFLVRGSLGSRDLTRLKPKVKCSFLHLFHSVPSSQFGSPPLHCCLYRAIISWPRISTTFSAPGLFSVPLVPPFYFPLRLSSPSPFRNVVQFMMTKLSSSPPPVRMRVKFRESLAFFDSGKKCKL